MATNSQLIGKFLRGQELNEVEIQQLERGITDHDMITDRIKSFMGLENKIGAFALDLPFQPIFSAPLEQDYATFSIATPEIYRHLLIYGSGRTTGSGTGTENLLCRFNNDAGANYSTQKLTVSNTTVTAARDTGQTQTIIGGLAQGGRADEDAISFVAFIPFANGRDIFKTSLALVGPPMFLHFGNWTPDPVDAIHSIELIPGADSIAANSVISVFGIK